MVGLIDARSKSASKSNSAAFCLLPGQGTLNAGDPTFTGFVGAGLRHFGLRRVDKAPLERGSVTEIVILIEG